MYLFSITHIKEKLNHVKQWKKKVILCTYGIDTLIVDICTSQPMPFDFYVSYSYSHIYNYKLCTKVKYILTKTCPHSIIMYWLQGVTRFFFSVQYITVLSVRVMEIMWTNCNWWSVGYAQLIIDYEMQTDSQHYWILHVKTQYAIINNAVFTSNIL